MPDCELAMQIAQILRLPIGISYWDMQSVSHMHAWTIAICIIITAWMFPNPAGSAAKWNWINQGINSLWYYVFLDLFKFGCTDMRLFADNNTDHIAIW